MVWSSVSVPVVPLFGTFLSNAILFLCFKVNYLFVVTISLKLVKVYSDQRKVLHPRQGSEKSLE